MGYFSAPAAAATTPQIMITNPEEKALMTLEIAPGEPARAVVKPAAWLREAP